MKQSMQTIIKEIVIEYLKDGKPRSVSEIKEEVLRNGIIIKKESSALRTALFTLKKENDCVVSKEKGIYQYIDNRVDLKNSISKYNFDDFETIESCTRKKKELVVSIMTDGTFSLNPKLFEYFPNQKAEIKLKKDSSEIALLSNGTTLVYLGKNGRTKNYKIVEKMKKNKIKLPVYYVGEWDQDEGVWIGKIAGVHPNSRKNNKEKNK